MEWEIEISAERSLTVLAKVGLALSRHRIPVDRLTMEETPDELVRFFVRATMNAERQNLLLRQFQRMVEVRSVRSRVKEV